MKVFHNPAIEQDGGLVSSFSLTEKRPGHTVHKNLVPNLTSTTKPVS